MSDDEGKLHSFEEAIKINDKWSHAHEWRNSILEGELVLWFGGISKRNHMDIAEQVCRIAKRKKTLTLQIVVNIKHKLLWRVTKTDFEEILFTNSEDVICWW